MATDRLTGLDASFLHLEDASSHMHVASVMIFEGPPPPYDELLEAFEGRLGLVPRYRQRLAFVPFGQGRPRWVDDPHLNLRYHVRSTALPSPGSEDQLKDLAGRVLSQQLDRDKPLWEVWLVEGLEDDRFAVLSKTHHALVDGVSGVDILSVLFDTSREPAAPADRGERWLPRPLPSRSQLLAEALLERATIPAEITRSVRAISPRPAAHPLRARATPPSESGRWPGRGSIPAPASPYNKDIGPHRRFTWVRADLRDIKAIKDALGGTVNDVVLATVAGALGKHLRRRGQNTDGLELKAMVPVSVRQDVERGALGNRVAAMMAPLPVWCQEPVARLDIVREELKGLKSGSQAVGAQVLTDLSGFAPPNDHGPGVAAHVTPALLQPRCDERARPAVPALPARQADARPVPDGAAGEAARASASRCCPTTGGSTSGSSATSTCSGTSTTSRATWRTRSPSWPPKRASSCASLEPAERV